MVNRMGSADSTTEIRKRLDEFEQSVERVSSVSLVGSAGVIASVAVLLVTAAALVGTAARVLDHAEKANSVQVLLGKVDSLQESLSTASIAARIYIVGHDPRVARERDRAATTVRNEISDLRAAMASDPDASYQLREASRLIERRLAMFAPLRAGVGTSTAQSELARVQLIQRTNAMIAGLRIRAAGSLNFHQRRIAANIRIAIGLALFAAATAPALGVLGIIMLRRERDSRRARELQMELMHVQRLAVMGETSTMLAHEINQPLTAASNYLAVLRRHLESGSIENAEAVAERTTKQIQRASTILRKLRRFVEKREAERSLEAPEGLVEDALTLLGTLDSAIQLETRIDPDLPVVMVDRVQMQQVLVNLLRNAIEAMEGMPRRELRLTVAQREDGCVLVSLADRGPGLRPDIAHRLFQPFVTSKSGGMGVGLSISRSIIEQHHGRLWAEPNNPGTVFHFTLPPARRSAYATA